MKHFKYQDKSTLQLSVKQTSLYLVNLLFYLYIYIYIHIQKSILLMYVFFRFTSSNFRKAMDCEARSPDLYSGTCTRDWSGLSL